MTRSFLNIVTADGRLCRVAELGFHADSPSFDGDGILFRQRDSWKRIDLGTGMISPAKPPAVDTRTSRDGRYTVRLYIESEDADGFGYVHLMLRDNESGTETVLTRFMGCVDSIGAVPFSADSVSIAFFGYPESELG